MTKGDIFINKEELCNRLCISTDFFDSHFLKDPRLKVHEIRRGTKFLRWPTEKIVPIAIEIMYELSN